jgi:hypothetical protein
MRARPTTQPAKTAAYPRTHLPGAGSESVALRRSSCRRAIHPSFGACLPRLFPSFAVKNVISRSSAPAALRLTPTFAAVSRQNGPAKPPLANTRLPSLPRRRKGAQSKGRTPIPRRNLAPNAVEVPRVTSHGSRVTAFLIYGTGIKKLWKPTPIDEYKLLIYGKPRPHHPALRSLTTRFESGHLRGLRVKCLLCGERH